MSADFTLPSDNTNHTPNGVPPAGFRPMRTPVRKVHEYEQSPQTGAPSVGPGGPWPYRDPWLTGGWFVKLLQDRESTAPKQPDDFPSSGSRRAIVVILLVQAVLSIRLLGANTGSRDEGLSLWAGYLQLSHQISLSQLEGLAARFPGSPEIYPPLGALAAQSGGLAGARLLSLAFMLLTTGMLYAVSRRLWSARMPAIFAAALFGWLGSVQFLGFFGSYAAMALCLLALATWFGVRAVPCRLPAQAVLLAAAVICVLVANATMYMSAAYDPVVIAVYTLATWRVRRWSVAVAAGCAMAVATAFLVIVTYWVAGSRYQAGVRLSTLSRVPGDAPAAQILAATGRWTGLLVLLASAAAIAIAWRYRDPATVLLGCVLTGAALLAPALAARSHTTAGLYEQLGFGAWFACIPAGWILAYAFDAHNRGDQAAAEPRRLTAGRTIAILAIVASAAIGVVSSTTQFHSWPNSSAAAAELTRLVKPNGEYLAEDYGQFTYDLREEVPLPHWWSTVTFDYPDPKTKKQLSNASAYAAAIRDRYFNVIVLDFQATDGTDRAIEQDIKKYRNYRLVAAIPFTTSAGPGSYLFWIPIRSRLPVEGMSRRGPARPQE